MKFKKILAVLLSAGCMVSSFAAASSINMLSPKTQSVVYADTINGDVNGNGKIDLQDAILIAKYLLNPNTLTTEQQKIADYNGDGKTNLQDAIAIAKKLVTTTVSTPSSPNVSTVIPSIVYYTKTGKCYHYSNTCNGGTYYPCSYDEAVNVRKLKPCDKCVN